MSLLDEDFNFSSPMRLLVTSTQTTEIQYGQSGRIVPEAEAEAQTALIHGISTTRATNDQPVPVAARSCGPNAIIPITLVQKSRQAMGALAAADLALKRVVK